MPVGLDELTDTVRFTLKPIQYRPELINGCLAETGLIIHPPSAKPDSRATSLVPKVVNRSAVNRSGN